MWPSLFFFISGILLSWVLFLTCFLFDLPQYSAFLVLFLQYIFLHFISSYPYFLPSSHFNLFSFIFLSSFIYSLIQHILVELLSWSRHAALYSFSWMKLRLNWFTILFILQLHTCICHCGLSQEPLSCILNYLYIEQLYSSFLLRLPVFYCTLCLNVIENNCRKFTPLSSSITVFSRSFYHLKFLKKFCHLKFLSEFIQFLEEELTVVCLITRSV